MACPFCAIARGEAPAAKVYEDELVVAFLDVNPVNPGHTLIAPKRHVERFDELTVEEAARIAVVAMLVAKTVTRIVGADGYNIVSNNGYAAGQRVMHVHVHVIPRFRGDNCRFTCRGRPARLEELRPLGERVRSELEKMATILERLKNLSGRA